MKTLLIDNPARKNSKEKSRGNNGSNKTTLITKSETFRSSKDAQDRAQYLREINIGGVFILQKHIEVYYVRYKIAR
jgi:hypothetical protein